MSRADRSQGRSGSVRQEFSLPIRRLPPHHGYPAYPLQRASEAMPRTPSQADPRSVVAQSRLEEDPRLKTMWAGYAFARDFREDCGHAFMLDDQTYSERQQAVQQPGTCLYHHTSDRSFFFTPPARPAPRPAPRRARWTVATRFRACCCSFALP